MKFDSRFKLSTVSTKSKLSKEAVQNFKVRGASADFRTISTSIYWPVIETENNPGFKISKLFSVSCFSDDIVIPNKETIDFNKNENPKPIRFATLNKISFTELLVRSFFFNGNWFSISSLSDRIRAQRISRLNKNSELFVHL